MRRTTPRGHTAAPRRGGLRRFALDHGALPSLRLLPGERRRRRADPGPGGPRPGPETDAGLPARRCPGCGVPRRRGRPQQPRLRDLELQDRRSGPLRDGRARPRDVDVVQSYENFTGGVVMSLIEHGFCTYENANEVIAFDNLIAPTAGSCRTRAGQPGRVLHARPRAQHEAVRQIRGTPEPGRGRRDRLVNSGPMVAGDELDLRLGGHAVNRMPTAGETTL